MIEKYPSLLYLPPNRLEIFLFLGIFFRNKIAFFSEFWDFFRDYGVLIGILGIFFRIFFGIFTHNVKDFLTCFFFHCIFWFPNPQIYSTFRIKWTRFFLSQWKVFINNSVYKNADWGRDKGCKMVTSRIMLKIALVCKKVKSDFLTDPQLNHNRFHWTKH